MFSQISVNLFGGGEVSLVLGPFQVGGWGSLILSRDKARHGKS